MLQLDSGRQVRATKKARIRYQCPVHKGIMDRCIQALEDFGYFHKETILEETGFSAVADSVRWDYITEFLTDPEDEWNLELVPLAPRFFKESQKKRENTTFNSLGRYLAGGHGKKTAGYASVTMDGGRLALKHAWKLSRVRNGIGEAWDVYAERVKAQVSLPEDDVLQLEKWQEKNVV